MSRLLADLVIENKLKQRLQRTLNGGILDWVRLKEELLECFEYLNTLHDSIKWTNEREKDHKIAIFDILTTVFPQL